MSSILLYHPLGLGDHLVCAGLVREYAKRFSRVGVFCFPLNAPSVRFMYRDLPNVFVVEITSHTDAKQYSWRNSFFLTNPHFGRIQTIGTFDVESGVQYERQMYKMAEVPFEKLWSSFALQRDPELEAKLAENFTTTEPYQFIHDDARFPIELERLGSLPQVRPQKELTQNVFDYCSLIEGAEEIHVMDSSFMFLVDLLPYEHPGQKLFVHRYTRPNMAWNLPVLKKPWTILT